MGDHTGPLQIRLNGTARAIERARITSTLLRRATNPTSLTLVRYLGCLLILYPCHSRPQPLAFVGTITFSPGGGREKLEITHSHIRQILIVAFFFHNLFLCSRENFRVRRIFASYHVAKVCGVGFRPSFVPAPNFRRIPLKGHSPSMSGQDSSFFVDISGKYPTGWGHTIHRQYTIPPFTGNDREECHQPKERRWVFYAI